MFLLVACAEPEPQISVSPDRLDYGEVSFTAEMPDEGFATAQLTYTNDGDADASLTLPAYDLDHLCIEGFPGDAAQEMTTMGPGSIFVLNVGICGYIQGEAESLVESVVEVTTDVLPTSLVVDVVFTPIRVTD